ncbi:MAG TPA: GNAT family N-acetyltransferase [Bacilli bacterium]
MVFVAKEYRRRGIASRLFADAEHFLQQNGRKSVYFSSYAPNYILPGIDEQAYPEGFAFLQSKGFQIQYSPVAMDFSLVGFTIPDDVKELKQKRIAEGFTFGFVEDKDLYEVIRFATHVFNADWGRAIREGILQGLPMSQVMVAREKSGAVVGFCMFGAYEGIRERFGPFGVDPKLRGTGLGKILLYDCLAAMKAVGVHGSWFLWTGEESPAGYLYKRVGYHVSRRFHVMKKNIE